MDGGWWRRARMKNWRMGKLWTLGGCWSLFNGEVVRWRVVSGVERGGWCGGKVRTSVWGAEERGAGVGMSWRAVNGGVKDGREGLVVR